MIILPDLFTPYIEGRQQAIKDNWADIQNYNDEQAAQIKNAFDIATFSPTVNRVYDASYQDAMKTMELSDTYQGRIDAQNMSAELARLGFPGEASRVSAYSDLWQQNAPTIAGLEMAATIADFGARDQVREYDLAQRRAAIDNANAYTRYFQGIVNGSGIPDGSGVPVTQTPAETPSAVPANPNASVNSTIDPAARPSSVGGITDENLLAMQRALTAGAEALKQGNNTPPAKGTAPAQTSQIPATTAVPAAQAASQVGSNLTRTQGTRVIPDPYSLIDKSNPFMSEAPHIPYTPVPRPISDWAGLATTELPVGSVVAPDRTQELLGVGRSPVQRTSLKKNIQDAVLNAASTLPDESWTYISDDYFLMRQGNDLILARQEGGNIVELIPVDPEMLQQLYPQGRSPFQAITGGRDNLGKRNYERYTSQQGK